MNEISQPGVSRLAAGEINLINPAESPPSVWRLNKILKTSVKICVNPPAQPVQLNASSLELLAYLTGMESFYPIPSG
jgi:hypothetical protein